MHAILANSPSLMQFSLYVCFPSFAVSFFGIFGFSDNRECAQRVWIEARWSCTWLDGQMWSVVVRLAPCLLFCYRLHVQGSLLSHQLRKLLSLSCSRKYFWCRCRWPRVYVSEIIWCGWEPWPLFKQSNNFLELINSKSEGGILKRLLWCPLNARHCM